MYTLKNDVGLLHLDSELKLLATVNLNLLWMEKPDQELILLQDMNRSEFCPHLAKFEKESNADGFSENDEETLEEYVLDMVTNSQCSEKRLYSSWIKRLDLDLLQDVPVCKRVYPYLRALVLGESFCPNSFCTIWSLIKSYFEEEEYSHFYAPLFEEFRISYDLFKEE
jgi:hypothetical protein